MANKALFDIDGDGGDFGFDATHGVTHSITLRDTNVASWLVQVWDPNGYDDNDDIFNNPPRASKSAPLLTLVGLTSGKLVAQVPTGDIDFVPPASGTHSWIVRSVVDGGHDARGNPDPSKVHTRVVVVRAGALRKPVITEGINFETDSWAGVIADMVDLLNAAPLGSAYTNVQENGVARPQSNTLNFVGATVADVAGVTQVTITGGGATPGVAVGQTQVWNGSAWVPGALNLADADARTGTLPAANGGTGLAGAGGTPNRALVTADGSTWTAGLVALATMVSGLLSFANLGDGLATSVLGRASGTSGVQASIAAAADGQALRRAAGALGFGAIDVADGDAITGTLPSANGGTGIAGAGGTSNRVLLTTNGTSWSAGLVSLSTMVTGQVPAANFEDGAATSVFGRAAGTVGAQASIAATVDGQALRRAGGVLGWGAIDVADGDAVTGLLPHANIASLAGLSVFGRSANTTGVMAAITAGTDGHALRRSGTAIGFGTLATAAYADASVTLAKLASGTASSVLGRSAGTGGAYADIVSSADGQVFVRGALGVLGWGAVDLADGDAVTGLLSHSNIANGLATSVFGRAGGAAGVQASIAASADGQVLQRLSGTLSFAALSVGAIGGGSAVGQVLTNAVGNVPTWGALDVGDPDGVTGLLPHANVASLAGLSVFGRGAGTLGVMAAITGSTDLVLRVDGAGSALAFGQVATGGIANSAVTLAKLANATASSVLGRSAATGGAYADIASSADGQVLRRGASGVIAFGAVNLADADAVTGTLPFTRLGNATAYSVLGRGANTAGAYADIVAGSTYQVLQRNGATAVLFDYLLPNHFGSTVPAFTVMGNTGSSAGTMSFFAGTAGSLLGVVGTTLSFTKLDPTMVDNRTVPLAKLVIAAANSVLGRSTISSGDRADIVATVGGTVLRFDGNDIGFGALDLADADATTGLLAGTKVSPNFGSQNITSTGFLTIGSSGAGAIRMPNNSELYAMNLAGSTPIALAYVNTSNSIIYGDTDATDISMVANGGTKLVLGASAAEFGGGISQVRFDSAITGGVSIIHEAIATAGLATANKMSIQAQNRTGTGATVGAELGLASGTGATAGVLRLQTGTTDVFVATPATGAIAVGDASFVGIEHAYIGSRDIVSLCSGSAISATQMPAGTGHGVVYVADATTAPGKVAVNAVPVGGSLLWSDATLGLMARGKSAVESTITPAGPTVNPDTADRLVYNNVIADRISSSSAATRTVVTVDLNQYGSATLIVRGKVVAYSSGGYTGASEVVCAVKCNGGASTMFGPSTPGWNDANGVHGSRTELTASAFVLSGSDLLLQVTCTATDSYAYFGAVEIFGAGDS